MIWCHGGLSSAGDGALMDGAARRRGVRLVAVDRPGIGDGPRRRCLSVRAWAEQVVDELGLADGEPVAVAGWSAGGPYALALAAVAPAHVSAVAAVASMHPLTERRFRIELGLLADRILLVTSRTAPRATRVGLAPVRLVPPALSGWVARRWATPAEREALRPMAGVLADALGGATRHGVAGVVDDYARLGSRWGIDLGRISTPVTIWHGAQDPMVPVEHGRHLTTLIPSARCRVLAGHGHFLPVTAGDEILSDLVGDTAVDERDPPA